MSQPQVQAVETDKKNVLPDPELAVYAADGRRIDHEVNRSVIETYNFRNPGFLRQGDLRQLELLHQKFVEHLCARLSTFLRMECLVKML